MAKDAYWFKHDSTSGRGLRIKKLQHIYGHWGKGVYWDVIEVLREQNNYCFDSDENSLEMLSELIGTKDNFKFFTWFKDCIDLGLFEIQNNKFFSQVLIENMEVWETKKDNGSKGGRPKKTEIKPKLNRIKTETLTESKANQKHKIIEDKIIEDNTINMWFNDLLNSAILETIAMNNKFTIESVKLKVEEFKKAAELDYPNYAKFASHFKNWIVKNPPTQNIIKPFNGMQW